MTEKPGLRIFKCVCLEVSFTCQRVLEQNTEPLTAQKAQVNVKQANLCQVSLYRTP